MKKLITLLVVGSLLISGCRKDKPAEPKKNYTVEQYILDGITYNKISGTIDEDFTFTNDIEWYLSGGVFVSNGATLSINEGTTIVADETTTAFYPFNKGLK